MNDLEKFILADRGTHILDIARFWFGEPEALYCQARRVHPAIRGEDVATVMLLARGGRTMVTCEMGCAVRVTTRSGTRVDRFPPARYTWSDPTHEVVQAGIVACNRHLVSAQHGEVAAETTAEDNLETLRLVHACHGSAAGRRVVRPPPVPQA